MSAAARSRIRTAYHAPLLLLLLLLAGLMLAAAAAASEPSVVRELPDKRTQYSTTYLLSDGGLRAVLYQSPVNYKDAAGDWRPIDPTLVPVVGTDAVTTEAAPVAVTVADEAPGVKPITVESGHWSVTMNLVGCTEDEKQVDAASATFAAIAPGTDVTYQALGDGVKETITLASNAAPNLFTYRLTHAGLALRRDETGQWGLYAEGAVNPVFVIGAMNACDSSQDEAGEPAWCNAAQMSVAPGEGASTITFSVPRAWLADPARAWPVKIDPQLLTSNPTDTYISAGYPDTAYGSSETLLCGKVSTATGECKTLVRFPQIDADIPTTAHVSAATFSIRQFWQPDPNDDRTHVYEVGSGSTLYNDATTYNSIHLEGCGEINNNYSPDGQDWLDVSCPGILQRWVRRDAGVLYNRGFMIAQLNGDTARDARKFRSGEYSGGVQWRPNITVDYDQPTVSISSPTQNQAYAVGSVVTTQVSVGGVSDSSQITKIRMGVNRTDSSSSRYRGVLGWFRDPPVGNANWVYQKASSGDGYFAYYNSTAYGSQYIEPDLASCSVNSTHTLATFVFKPKESWPDATANRWDTCLDLSAGSSSWGSGWTQQSAHTFTVDPSVGPVVPLTCLTSTTTASSSWFSGSGNNDADFSGRGSVTLKWPAVDFASGYRIYLWDGAKYDQVDAVILPGGDGKWSWTSAGKSLFPNDSGIASIPTDSGTNPFSTTYGRRELRDDPTILYQRMSGGTSRDTDYRFVVVPYNATTGAANFDDCAPLRVTLDSRTVTASEDPQHTVCDLDSWDGHDLACQLDSGALWSLTTDLAIASWGPSADLSRTYSSAQTAAGTFAPGWFFNFEQSLAIGASQIVYTDAERLPHTFAGSGSTWTAPNGFFATLTPSGANWRLTFFDQSYLTFDASGKIISETDDHGSITTYTWTSGLVTRITAANTQQINLTYASGKLSSASYTTAAGTRTVNYTTASPWSATLYPGVTGVQKMVTYGYTSSRLTSITQEAWPISGQSALTRFVYNASNKLTEVDFADMFTTTSAHTVVKSDAKATVAYDSATQATIKRYGTVNGTAGQPLNQEVLTWRAATAGVPNQLAARTTGSGSLASTETYNYAGDRQLATTTNSDGGQTNDTVNLQHDRTSTAQTTGSLAAVNQTTNYVCDSLHRVTSETSYQGPAVYATTTNTYVGADLTAVQTADQSGALLSASSYAYSSGRLTQDKQLVSGTVASGTWTQTDYSSFAPCGEPQTTIARGVKLSSAAAPQDLTQTSSYDAFGNELSATDWGGRTNTTNTYDIAGNALTSTDAAAVVARTSYDCMGNATESYQTATGTQVKENWTTTTYDPMGREKAATTKLSSASGTPITQSVATTTYDGAGNEVTVDDTSLGGQDAQTKYDASANATEAWDAGVADYTTAGRSTRSLYDPRGNRTYESAPGNANAPGSGAVCTASTYDTAGSLLSEKQPDGTKTLHAYDGQTNETTSEGDATTSSDFQPWIEQTSYDAASRAVSKTDAQQSHTGLVTTITVDKLGRSTIEKAERDGAPSEPVTTTTYNDLGWVLESVDANGVTTSTVYDSHGAVASETSGTKTTTSTYDAASGRLQSTSDADGTVVAYTYDAFGNVKREFHQASGGTVLKDLGGASGTTLDSLGRPTAQTEAVSGLTHSWSYPQNAAAGTQETLAYGGSPATSLALARNGREMELSRTATIASGVTVTLAVSDSSSGRDTADRWQQRTITQSGRTAKMQSRSFDAADRLATQSGLGLTAAGSYSYDANSGLKTAASLPLALGGAISDTFSYYPGGRLATATTNGVEAAYTLDEAGNLVTDVESDLGTTTFSYDVANRLTSTTLTPAGDGATAVTTYYGWDAQNAWRTSQGPAPDPTPANEPISFAYNALGRMSHYGNTTRSTSADYTYDGSGQRTKSVVSAGSTTTTTNFAYGGLTLLKLSATQGATTWSVDYLYDEEDVPYGGVYRSPATSASPTYFTLVTSDRGDVVELCDADGNAFAAYRYDAWGSPQGAGSYATGVWTQSTSLVTATLAGQIASRQILRYAGYAYDSESGLYYCSARFYDSATRQWTTDDPAKADGEESAYQYCGGEPVGNVDPAGDYFIVNGERVYGIRKTSPMRLKALAYEKKLVGRKMRTRVNNWFWGKGNEKTADWCEALQAFVFKSCGSKANWHRYGVSWSANKKGDSTVTTLYNDARYHSKASGKRLITPTSGGTVDLSLAKPGDLVLFDWDKPGWNHVGMVKKRGVVIEGNSPVGDTPVKLHYDRWNSGIKAVVRITR